MGMVREIHVNRLSDIGMKNYNYRPDHLTAKETFSKKQMAAYGLIGGILWMTIIRYPWELIGVTTTLSCLYLLHLVFRLYYTSYGVKGVVEVSDEAIAEVSALDLPTLTILLPLFGEPEPIIRQLGRSIEALDYPHDRLDIKFLTENRDVETHQTVRSMNLGAHCELVIKGDGIGPQTKPCIVNIGLHLARGVFFVIFDAEDLIDRFQPKKAIATFLSHPVHEGLYRGKVSAVQCKLQYGMPEYPLFPFTWKNLLRRANPVPRMQMVDYAHYFNIVMAGFAARRQLTLFGGTSNYFRLADVMALGAYDAWNVTEDQDMGVWFFRRGLRVIVIQSITWERCTESLKSLLFQRSRWKKGGLQTYFTHMRDIRGLWRDLGPFGFFNFQMVLGLVHLMLIVNPIFWLTFVVYQAARIPQVGGHNPHLAHAIITFIASLYPGPVLYLANISAWGGNIIFMISLVIAARCWGKPGSVKWVIFQPLNWILLSCSEWIALKQIFFGQASQWYRTDHVAMEESQTALQGAEAETQLALD
jgi:cellulose synthase/poly-beta-1,6-N-acetylglucosamine synthase-like glycosyltransferase